MTEPKVNTDKALGLGKTATGGILAVFSSRIASKLVSLVGSVILVRLLISPANFGILSVATVLPGLTMLGDVTGAYSALQKDVAAFKAGGDSARAWSSFWTVLLVKGVTGACLSVLAFLLSFPVAELLGKPNVAPFFQIGSILPLVWVLQNSGKVLIAMDKSRYYALLDILDEILLSACPIIPVLMGFGIYGAMVGLVMGNVLFLIATLSVLVREMSHLIPHDKRSIQFRLTFIRVTKWGLPLGISNSFGSFTGQLINLIVARFVSLGIYGLYSVASSAVSFVGYVDDAIGSVAYPTFSKLEIKNEPATLQVIFRYAVKFSTIAVIPMALFASIFAKPIIVFLFGAQYTSAGPYLTILSLAFLAYGLGSGLISDMLQSQGYTKFLGGLAIMYTSIQVVVAAFVIPTFGFIPYLLANLFVFVPTFIIKVRKARKTLGIFPPLKAVFPVYVSAAVSAIPSILLQLLYLPEVPKIILGAFILLTIYFVTLVMLGGISTGDIQLAKSILASQPIIGKPVNAFLMILDRLSRSAIKQKNQVK